ncbi:MAG: RecX family transcriptional regulator [Rhodovarius sp.]|nr:RecX family transcriptional regulator [Rhodovarius sp.]MCX7933439.1 RecX family transcriptional regulator [Rhodovarius sp.]MDW8315693.1 RecX family transcriptional regulator [Rhodovarius sp.]
MRKAQPRPAGPPPDEAALHAAALAHLARFAATEAGLIRVLANRIRRWARRAEAEGREVEQETAAALALARRIAARLVAAGAVDDAAFAAARARRLARAGRSRRAAAAHLAARGVDAETAARALAEAPSETDAALALCRRRRIGPFAPAPPGPEERRRALAILARAGFGREVAEAALATPREEAELRLARLRA